MSANVTNLKSYKRKKLFNKIPIFDIFSVFSNIFFTFGCAILFIVLFFKPPNSEMDWLGKTISISLSLFLIYHAYKVFRIMKEGKFNEEMEYFIFYIMFNTVILFLSCLLSTAAVGSMSDKLQHFMFPFVGFIFNIIVIIRMFIQQKVNYNDL